MKVGIYADAHFSLNSSIILGQSNSLEGRLEHLVDSFGWMYGLFRDHGVDLIVDLGDLADSYVLRAEEITAISRALSLNPGIEEVHVLGNHERLDFDGNISSINFVDSFPRQRVVSSVETLDLGGRTATLLPYSNGYDDAFVEGLPATDYLFSHIDIFGSNTGLWSLREGVRPTVLANRFGLTVNGHIHNGSWVIPGKVLNLGSISGQNFSSRQIEWNPSVAVLDTETSGVELFANPHALVFVNSSCSTVDKVVRLSDGITEGTYAVQVRVPVSLVDEARRVLQANPNIVASRVMTRSDKAGLEGKGFDEIEHVNSVEGGFDSLVSFIDAQETLPYPREDIMRVVLELEENRLS